MEYIGITFGTSKTVIIKKKEDKSIEITDVNMLYSFAEYKSEIIPQVQ